MKMLSGLVTGVIVSALLAGAAGCADSNRTGRPGAEPGRATGAKNAWPADQYAALSQEDRDGAGADVGVQNAEKYIDVRQSMGRRSLPFFPVFAVRPW
jgi:hypothetical protein